MIHNSYQLFETYEQINSYTVLYCKQSKQLYEKRYNSNLAYFSKRTWKEFKYTKNIQNLNLQLENSIVTVSMSFSISGGNDHGSGFNKCWGAFLSNSVDMRFFHERTYWVGRQEKSMLQGILLKEKVEVSNVEVGLISDQVIRLISRGFPSHLPHRRISVLLLK